LYKPVLHSELEHATIVPGPNDVGQNGSDHKNALGGTSFYNKLLSSIIHLFHKWERGEKARVYEVIYKTIRAQGGVLRTWQVNNFWNPLSYEDSIAMIAQDLEKERIKYIDRTSLSKRSASFSDRSTDAQEVLQCIKVSRVFQRLRTRKKG
jgi:hypothetical protein